MSQGQNEGKRKASGIFYDRLATVLAAVEVKPPLIQTPLRISSPSAAVTGKKKRVSRKKRRTRVQCFHHMAVMAAPLGSEHSDAAGCQFIQETGFQGMSSERRQPAGEDVRGASPRV